MVIIFECNSLLARSLALYFQNYGESLILPSVRIPSLKEAFAFLRKNADMVSLILISSCVSFQNPPRTMGYQGLDVLENILMLEAFDDIPKILYSFDSVERLAGHGGELLFKDDYEEIFHFVKLPARIPT